MKKVIFFCLFLASCNSFTEGINTGFLKLISPGKTEKVYSNKNESQATALEEYGYRKTPYVLGMSLVPCMELVKNSHVKMSIKERVDYQRKNGGYLADCGQLNDEFVWGNL